MDSVCRHGRSNSSIVLRIRYRWNRTPAAGVSDTQTIINKTLVSNSTQFQDNVDNTKNLKFLLTGLIFAVIIFFDKKITTRVWGLISILCVLYTYQIRYI